MRTFIQTSLGLVLFGTIASLSGCSSGPTFAEVEGTVKRNGKALDKIHVEFCPETDGPKSIGETDAEGRFVLKSIDGNRPGAVVGPHKIVLRDVGVLGEKFLGRAAEGVDMSKGKQPRIPDHYSDLGKTDLKKEVTAGQKNIFDLEVK